MSGRRSHCTTNRRQELGVENSRRRAYNIRWFVHINLRALIWLVELRSTPQGHETYRKAAQKMFRCVEQVHPLLSQYLKFVDLNDYPLGRLGAEMRQASKRSV